MYCSPPASIGVPNFYFGRFQRHHKQTICMIGWRGEGARLSFVCKCTGLVTPIGTRRCQWPHRQRPHRWAPRTPQGSCPPRRWRGRPDRPWPGTACWRRTGGRPLWLPSATCSSDPAWRPVSAPDGTCIAHDYGGSDVRGSGSWTPRPRRSRQRRTAIQGCDGPRGNPFPPETNAPGDVSRGLGSGVARSGHRTVLASAGVP